LGKTIGMQTKIFLVEGHDFVRHGLRALLKSHFIIIGEASSGAEAIKKIEEQENELPHLILMDMNMVEMNGMECARIIKRKYPDIKVLMLSVNNDVKHLSDMLFSGVEGYIMKNSSSDELLFAIKKIINNDIYIGSEFSLNILNKLMSDGKNKQDGESKSDGKGKSDGQSDGKFKLDWSFKKDGESKADGKHKQDGESKLDGKYKWDGESVLLKLLEYNITEREMDVLVLIGEGLTNSEIADKLFTSVRTIETRRRNLLEKTKTKNTAMLIMHAVKNGLLQ
jgi:DNA-binding NarL/FixJ family response regulator